jgi:acyl-CoA thioesterase FadM
MYPLVRLFASSFRAALSKTIGMDAVCETTFRCMPWDIDIFLEMNNGRILTLYDLGRFDLSIRTGLVKVLKKKRWGLVVAGSTVRYRRRIKMFDKVSMRTKVVGFEGRWIYVEQSMWVKGQAASSVLLRVGVTGKGKAIQSDKVLEAMGIPNWKPEPSGWVKSWISSEEHRPWPPSF